MIWNVERVEAVTAGLGTSVNADSKIASHTHNTHIQAYASVTIQYTTASSRTSGKIKKIKKRSERGTRSMKITPGCNFFSLTNQVKSKHNVCNSLQFHF